MPRKRRPSLRRPEAGGPGGVGALLPQQIHELWLGPPGVTAATPLGGRRSAFRSDADRREAWRTYRALRRRDPTLGPPPTWASGVYGNTTRGGGHGSA